MHHSQQHKQRGAALIISLIILLVMTIIGVAGMSQSGLETLMASNLQLQNQALSAAENQLKATEVALDDIATTPVAFNDFDENINPVELLRQEATVDTNFDANGFFARTYIEYIGPQTLPGESVVIGNDVPDAGGEIYLFRNTTINASNNSGARRILQSIYTIDEDPVAAGGGNG